jgi:diguanylate cyclase
MHAAYVIGAIVAFVIYPAVPTLGRQAVLLLMATATYPAVAVGMRRTDRARRGAWIFLLAGMALIYASTALRLFSGGWPTLPAEISDVTGYVVLMCAALALVLDHGRNNLGVVIDTAITALAIGGVLWTLVLRRQPPALTG